MLSYRRETALQGALQFSPKVEDWNWETIFYAISISDTCLRSRQSISASNFDKISQPTAEIKLLPVYENGRPPSWNFVSCFDFGELVIGMSFYVCLPNFIEIGGAVMTSYRIFKMVTIESEIYSRLQV